MISVIIPIHNAERMLPVCLDSLLAQRFPDWEALLVDDGSTDESLAVARRYSMTDRRFRCFHQDNAGVSAARNLGLRHATREWVYLLDADDSLFDNAFDLFFHHVSPEYDALVGGYVMVDESGRVTYSVNERAEISLSSEESLRSQFRPLYYKYLGYAGGKFYRRSVIVDHGLTFNESIFHNEDRLFNVLFFCHSRRVLLFTEPLFRYFRHAESATESRLRRFDEKFMTSIDAMIVMNRAIRTAGYSHSLKRLIAGDTAYLYRVCRRLMKKDHRSDTEFLCRMLRKKYRDTFSWTYYLLYIEKPALGDLLRKAGLLRTSRG